MVDKSIDAQSEIALHFSLKLESGELVDSNFEGGAARCKIGDGNLLASMEQYLMGLRAGDHKHFTVPPEQGFGQRQDDNIQQFSRSRFAGMALEPGLVVSFADAAKGEVPGVVSTIEDDHVTVDFNHPLAGKTLLFEVQIVEVN